MANVSLTSEDGCLGMDALETMTRLGGTVVGLELGMVQVPRASINQEPPKATQNEHCAHQEDEQVKERNEVDRIGFEPNKEQRQMHEKLSLDIKEDREPMWMDQEK